MKFRLIYTRNYIKRAARFAARHPDLIPQYEKTLKILEVNPFHTSLRLHRLKGPLSDLHSVSINISFRITMEFLFDDRAIIPVNVGKHEEVY